MAHLVSILAAYDAEVDLLPRSCICEAGVLAHVDVYRRNPGQVGYALLNLVIGENVDVQALEKREPRAFVCLDRSVFRVQVEVDRHAKNG